MKTRFVFPLSVKNLERLEKKLAEFEKTLKVKADELVSAMVEHGEEYALNAVGHIDTGETIDSVVGYRNGSRGVVVAGGNAIWLEFGTGVRHNGAEGSSPHPEGAEHGMLIGKYGDGHGSDPNGWFYFDDELGEVKHTYGIKANMFMYKTVRELEQKFPELAREIFND